MSPTAPGDDDGTSGSLVPALGLAGTVGLVLISLIPVALLYEYRSAAPVSGDLYFATHTFSTDAVTLLSSAEWEHEVTAGVRGYRPIVLLSYWFNSVLFEDHSSITGYRLFNDGIHSLAVIAVGALAYQLSASLTVALLAALLFGVHPVHHENVVWISGRTHSLSALFSVSALTLATFAWAHTTRTGLALLAILVALALGSFLEQKSVDTPSSRLRRARAMIQRGTPAEPDGTSGSPTPRASGQQQRDHPTRDTGEQRNRSVAGQVGCRAGAEVVHRKEDAEHSKGEQQGHPDDERD